MREAPPGTSCAEQIEQRVDDLPQVRRARPPPGFGRGNSECVSRAPAGHPNGVKVDPSASLLSDEEYGNGTSSSRARLSNGAHP